MNAFGAAKYLSGGGTGTWGREENRFEMFYGYDMFQAFEDRSCLGICHWTFDRNLKD
jgi:hypothetical protein